MEEYDPALSLPELRRVLHDSSFQMRLLHLFAQLQTTETHTTQTAAAFTVNKYSSGIIRCSDVLMPETSQENYGRDPTKEISLYPLFYGSPIPRHLASLVHSNPANPDDHGHITRLLSEGDAKLFTDHLHPANPGHIGGILLPPMLGGFDLLLYRATSQFDPDRLNDPVTFSAYDLETRRAAIESAGLALVYLTIASPDKIIGLNGLGSLYQ